ncbi:MAG: cytochrome C oxidase subunit IV family protein [Limnochordales bacterium]|nr:MAG: cytochrome C oxidase subunit IV [Bacillota bacterium]
MQQGQAVQSAQAATREYLRVGVTLFILTILEVAVIYVEALRPALVPILVLLSLWKFILVVNIFMHLKYDSRVYTGFFSAGMALAVLITAALVIMFAGR